MSTNETNNKQQNAGETPALQNRPKWQQISGIDPQRESEMDADARDAAIRKLIKEVTERATVEFERADAGKIPDGERTIFWDPLQRICMQLGISRTKLSSYSRELTGLRAHEISDRILAQRKLMDRLRARIEKILQPDLEFMREPYITQPHFTAGIIRDDKAGRVHSMKSLRKFEKAASFAAEMGFANFSRLNRACLLAFGKSLDQIEAELVCTYVQKFFNEIVKVRKEQDLAALKRQVRQEQPKKEQTPLTPQAEEIFRDAIAQTLGIKKEEVCVA